MNFYPSFLAQWVIGEQVARQIPEVLARVKQINNLNRAGKVLIGEIPDPVGAVADDDLVGGRSPR